MGKAYLCPPLKVGSAGYGRKRAADFLGGGWKSRGRKRKNGIENKKLGKQGRGV